MSDIVIRLTIDAAQLNTALTDVRNKLTDVGAKKVDIDTSSAETKIRSLRDNIAMWGLAIQGAVNTFSMVGRAVDALLKPALEAEAGMTRVRAAVESTGQAAGFTAEELKTMAERMQEAFALDADQIMNEITTPLLTYTKITGSAFEEAQVAVANLARTMDGDLKSAALQVGKALNDPAVGLTALQKSGVSFTAQQKEMIKDLWEAGDAAGAQAMILAELNKEFGGQAAAYAESYAGKIEAMKLAWEDLVEALGQQLLPVIAKVAGALADVIKWFTGLNGITKAALVITPLLAVAWHALTASAVGAAYATGGLSAAMGTVSTALGLATLAVKTFFVSIGPVGWAIMGLGAAIGALGLILAQNKKKMEENTQASEEMQGAISNAAASAKAEEIKFRALGDRLLELKRSTNQTAESKREMKGVIDELNSRYGQYIGNIDLETASYSQLERAVTNAANAIIAKTNAEAYGAVYSNAAQEYAKAMQKVIDKYGPEFAEDMINRPSRFFLPDWPKEIKAAHQALLDMEAAETAYRAKLKNTTSLTPKGPGKKDTGAGAGSGAGSKADAERKELVKGTAEYYEQVKFLDDKYYQWKTEQIKSEVAAYKISAEQKAALEAALLGKLDAERAKWIEEQTAAEVARREAEERVQSEAAARLGAATAEYYNELKFMDSGYYDWKRGQIEADVAALGLGSEQAAALTRERIAALDAEKAAWEAIPAEEARKRAEEQEQLLAAAQGRMREQTAAYYEQVKFLDEGYYAWKFEQITAEVEALENLSQEQRDAMLRERYAALTADQESWDASQPAAQETADLAAELAKRLADQESYMEALKFADSGYYDWKKGQIEAEVGSMKLEKAEADALLEQKLAALDRERAAYDALPIEEIKSRYDAFKSSMADSAEIGVRAWDSISGGLEKFRDELKQFEAEPGVAELIKQIEREIDTAKTRAANKGNWFWSGMLGFDPDKAEDQAKVAELKNTFRDLQGTISSILSSMADQNEARRDEELASIEETATREKWAEADLQKAREGINKRYDEEERKIKNAQKAMSIASAIINTAEAVTKALTLGPILGPIMAGIIGALGAVQIKLIASQKFASGGLFRGKGGPRDDQNMIMVSDGEYIVNAQSTKRHQRILDTINYGATNPSVYPQLRYADGGMVIGGNAGVFETLLAKLDVLNMNLVRKELAVTVENHGEIETTVRKGDVARKRMLKRGYSESLQR